MALGLIKRALIPDGKRWKKDDILDALFYVRIIYAFFLGIFFGVVPVTGLPAFLTFVLTQYLNGGMWLKYQDIDPEEYDTEGSMQGEGVGPSVSLFLLSWIISYSFAQF